eukprot:COSAG01_NODE_1156_length_11478_cov_3.862642_10_plen_101_part_00
MQWREIHHNFFIDNYSPQENVDNDDGSCFYHTHDNFLVYGGQGMKNDFGGHDNHHYGNVSEPSLNKQNRKRRRALRGVARHSHWLVIACRSTPTLAGRWA